MRYLDKSTIGDLPIISVKANIERRLSIQQNPLYTLCPPC